MHTQSPTLHVLCGKIASGKSTLAARLANSRRSVLVADDDWLNALFSDQLHSLSDYVRCSAKLRSVMAPHLSALLNAGVSVVLDFAANTMEQRRWIRGILETTNASHQLHLLATSDEVCLARLRARNAAGDHPFAVTPSSSPSASPSPSSFSERNGPMQNLCLYKLLAFVLVWVAAPAPLWIWAILAWAM